ncbi:MAG: DUF4105 domain-containing protein [Ferruginibacter sp.]|nr:DUF4105 domain-containing protein [Ferruginibacter sp.]
MKKIFFRFLFISILGLLKITNAAAQDSSRIRISLLTCTPGEELYSTFGHSAVRIIDSNSVTDHVYNFGTFNFDDAGFYLKFIRGQLRYYVNVEAFEDFKFGYVAENRGITEQVLNFTAAEKITIHCALIENIKEENKFYMYDFFYDNCTTRLRDIIVKYHHPSPVLPAVMPTTYTFRNAIHQYLDNNHKYWSKFGIDILLGAPTDAVMKNAQQEFLPENLMKALDSTKNTTIVSSSKNLYVLGETNNKPSLFTPLVLFSTVLFVFLLVSFFKGKKAQNILRLMDAFLFFTAGLLGIVLVFMWIGTDHIMTKNNYNLLWAWPMHIVYAFFIHKNSKRVKAYSMLVTVFLILFLCCWFFVAQKMNNALLPLVVLMIWRAGSSIGKANAFGKRTILQDV